MNNHYLMVCSSSYNHEGYHIEASTILMHRLENMYWPLYANTRNRLSISKGDKLAFYVSGKGKLGGQVVGSARISTIEKNKLKIARLKRIEEKVSLGQNIYSILKLSSIETETRIIFRDYFHEMSFSNKTSCNWGALLQGGCRKIEEKDFNILCQTSPK